MKDLIKTIRDRIEALSWNQYIAGVFVAFIAVAAIVAGIIVTSNVIKDSSVPEPDRNWKETEKVHGKRSDDTGNYVSNTGSTLSGENDSTYVGEFKADLGNSKSSTVEGSQYSPPTKVDYTDSAFPVEQSTSSHTPSALKRPSDGAEIKDPTEDAVNTGRISEPAIYY